MEHRKVSVITITYNQEKYIGQTLESMAVQETDFDFEVIVADDCSTDGTTQIIEDYVKKYPAIFKPILRKKNLGAWQNFVDSIRSAKGDYIAICEGDDYWTDSKKLQRQVDFLDNNPTYALCFHPVRVFFEDDERKEFIFPETNDVSKFTVKRLLERNFIQTNSVLYRRQDYKDLAADIMPGDWYLHLYHVQFGKIGFIDKVMSAYRRHPEGIWWNSNKNVDEIWKKYGLSHLRLYDEVLKLYGSNPQYEKILDNLIITLFDKLTQIDKKYGDNLIRKALTIYPNNAETYIRDLHKRTEALEDHSRKQAQIIDHYVRLSDDLRYVQAENDKLKAKLLIRLENNVKRKIRRKH